MGARCSCFLEGFVEDRKSNESDWTIQKRAMALSHLMCSSANVEIACYRFSARINCRGASAALSPARMQVPATILAEVVFG